MTIEQIEDPVDRFVAFIEEREAIRIRRASKLPWPWTQNEILQTYRFTNIHREDDAVSKHYQKTVRERYKEIPLVLPATVLYRWYNRISTCDALFNEPDFTNKSIFEYYVEECNLQVLLECINNIPPPHVTGAFIVTGVPGHAKGEGVAHYVHRWCQKPWVDVWAEWMDKPPLLSQMYDWIESDGLGSFMRGQIVADLKYLPFMLEVEDWWTWATPGPGSMRGLNIVLGRDMNKHWRTDDWLLELQNLSTRITSRLEDSGISKLHNQDLQNCLCEFSKFIKTMRGEGRPRQVFRHQVGTNA